MLESVKGIKLNLQLFADPPAGGTDPNTPPANDPPAGGADPNTPPAALTQADLEKAAQSAADKVRTEAAKKTAVLEAEIKNLKLKGMSDEERRIAELSEKDTALAEREAKILLAESRGNALQVLTANALPVEFQEFVMADTLEKTTERALNLKKVIDVAIAAGVKNVLKQNGYNPDLGAANPAGSVDPNSMTDEQWADWRKKNPEKI